jgi:hypothetical protein
MFILNKNIITQAILLIIPLFIVWKLVVGSFMLPIITTVTDYATDAFYSEFQPELLFNQETTQWELKTSLFKADRPYTNNSYSPNLTVSSSTHLIIGKLAVLTLGLPLFWLLIILSSSNKCRHLLFGTLILLALNCIYVILLVQYKINTYLQSSELIRFYTDPYIQKAFSLPFWLFNVMKPLLDASLYMNILVVPVWLAFRYYQKATIDINDKGDLLLTEQSLLSSTSQENETA